MKPPVIVTETGKVAASMLAGWGLDWADTIAAIEGEARRSALIDPDRLADALIVADDQRLTLGEARRKAARIAESYDRGLLKDADSVSTSVGPVSGRAESATSGSYPPCRSDRWCCRNDGHEGDHLYPTVGSDIAQTDGQP